MTWKTKSSMLKSLLATLLSVVLVLGLFSVLHVGAVEAEQDLLEGRHKSLDENRGQLLGTGKDGDGGAVTVDEDASELGEEEPIVIACGEEREFPISGKASASRTIRIKKRFTSPFMQLPEQDELTRFCRTTKKPLCHRVLREAKQKALNHCRQKGREIAASARCEETAPSHSGSHEEQHHLKPLLKKLQCVVVDPHKDCEWSFRLIVDKVHVIRVKVNQKYFDYQTKKWKRL